MFFQLIALLAWNPLLRTSTKNQCIFVWNTSDKILLTVHIDWAITGVSFISFSKRWPINSNVFQMLKFESKFFFKTLTVKVQISAKLESEKHFMILSGKRTLKLPLKMDVIKFLQTAIKNKLDVHALNVPILPCSSSSLFYEAREQKRI